MYGREWRRQDILRRVGQMGQVAGIKLVEAGDGRDRGSRILQVRTGSGLCFHVLADRALDISVCRYKGVPLAWMSSVGDVHPAYYEPQGMGLLRSFQGGLLLTCGLDQFGAPCSDQEEELGLHGRVSNLPASSVGYSSRWVDEVYELEITGEIRQTRLFGENLVLRRRISTHLGSKKIRIEDSVTNEAFAPHPHMILYHFNIGFPLVSEDSRLHLEAEETIPRDKDAEAGLAHWRDLQPPTQAYREQVFQHKLATDDEGKARVEIENPLLGVGLRLTYSGTDLPYLYQWKMMGEGMYVLGIEPANCGVMTGRAAARRRGELPHLRPGESRNYVLEAEVVEYR
ncbi:MAG: aldose 1-epimerase family protein [Chloroflexota bacterium]|nr:aldose 1-epimerase family protein [Anaerolineae bacterium]